MNWKGFPDEGIRFYFNNDPYTYLTIRPSGTSNALRFHFQVNGGVVPEADLIARKKEVRDKAAETVRVLREIIGATE